MRHITDLMATGNSSAEFLGRGLEINRVCVTPDFKGVNVFWIAKGTENDEALEMLLKKNAGQLRHELSQLRVMGVVPQIHFVKGEHRHCEILSVISIRFSDREFAKLMEVDLRLARADFGEDYVPVEPSYKLKSQLCLNAPLSQHVKEKIESIEKDATDFHEPPLPPMRMDVLGLNHAVIMHRIQQSMKRSLALHRQNVTRKETPEATTNEDPVRFESQQQQNEAFQEFLRKRRIMLDKAKRISNKTNFEYEHLRTLQEPLYDSKVFQNFSKTDEDYIEEDDVKECNNK